jgi:5S rRNA maturation endonuclease (ribonuclease M5)
MFKTIKEKLQISEVVARYTDEAIKLIGESATVESDTCPFCQHKNCFRIKLEADGEDGFYKCFSCDEHGDLITFVQVIKELGSPVEAAKVIATDFGIQLPVNSNPIQDIFTLASRYYRMCLLECRDKFPELMGMTPEEYQTKTRGHSLSTLEELQVGWSDGRLVEYLKALGIDSILIEESGLINKAGKDFLPAKSFIYPHQVKGKVSHFTFKDPLKKLAYQLKNSSKLNGHQWYNQDSIALSETVILVEGENDLASILDSGARNVVASIGSLASSQIEWLVENCSNKNIITLFDPDAAGDKYRAKIHKARYKFKAVKQIKPPEDKDIDELIRSGTNLQDLINSEPDAVIQKDEDEPTVTTFTTDRAATDEEAETIVKSSKEGRQKDIVVDGGGYSRVKMKEGVPYLSKISNFTIKLDNIYIRANRKRERNVIFRRFDGRTETLPVNSETKTSVKAFKTLAAEAVDGSFTGSESDLSAMWEEVYANSPEREVRLLDYTGLTEHGWVFEDIMITKSGNIIKSDAEGIFWPNGIEGKHRVGIKCLSIESPDVPVGKCKGSPHLETILSKEKNDEMLDEFIVNLARNLGDPGKALMAVGWLRAVAHSEWFYDLQKHFPHIWMIGKANSGKTTMIDWFLKIYGMGNQKGVFDLGTMHTPVAAERKIAYYSSLPICIDEMRADEMLTKYQGTFRSWYNRHARDKGTNEDSVSIKKQAIRSCIFYAGQDITNDSALMERLIIIEIKDQTIKANGRETKHSYDWIKERAKSLSSFGFHWIMETTTIDYSKLTAELLTFANTVTTYNVAYRYGVNYSLVKVMADDYAKRLFPKFNWEEYIVGMAKLSQANSDMEDVVYKFFEVAEALTVGDHARVTSEHFKVRKGMLYLNYNAVWAEVSKEIHRSKAMSETFSIRGLARRIAEQEWFVKGSKVGLGVRNEQRRVLVIDLEKSPEYIRTFAKYTLEGEMNEQSEQSASQNS